MLEVFVFPVRWSLTHITIFWRCKYSFVQWILWGWKHVLKRGKELKL